MCIDRSKTHKHVAKHPHSLPEERPRVSSTCSQRRHTYGPNKTQLQCDPLPSLSSHHLVSVLRYVFFVTSLQATTWSIQPNFHCTQKWLLMLHEEKKFSCQQNTCRTWMPIQFLFKKACLLLCFCYISANSRHGYAPLLSLTTKISLWFVFWKESEAWCIPPW